MAFTSLNHHLDYEWLYYAYTQTRKDGAVGVDGQTAKDYAVNLEENLQSLENRIKSGNYRAPPVRRHYIAKSDGGQRGLGIPSFEDKVAQRAIAMLLEPIYEQDFKDCSYGFRPGRSAHQALQAVRRGIMHQGGRWVLDVDIRKYFDSIPHAELRSVLAKRVTDGVVRRMIDKWLKAGVLEQGQVSYPEAGAPQGGVLSPILSNIYLHYVLDGWFAEQVRPRLRGPSTLIRYCDDFVILCAYKDDAERVHTALGKRLNKFGLQLHPDKTQLIDFRHRPRDRNREDDKHRTARFNFLGFVHIWGQSRKGNTVMWQLTAKDRLARALKAINEQCRTMRHWSVREQHQRLSRMLKGHYAYFGITGNIQRLGRLTHEVTRTWRKWLMRRSRQYMTWATFRQILAVFPLPRPRIIHRYADQ